MKESGTNSYTVETNQTPRFLENQDRISTNTIRDHQQSKQEDPLLKILKTTRNCHRQTNQEISTIAFETHRSLIQHHYSLPHLAPLTQRDTPLLTETFRR